MARKKMDEWCCWLCILHVGVFEKLQGRIKEVEGIQSASKRCSNRHNKLFTEKKTKESEKMKDLWISLCDRLVNELELMRRVAGGQGSIT